MGVQDVQFKSLIDRESCVALNSLNPFTEPLHVIIDVRNI